MLMNTNEDLTNKWLTNTEWSNFRRSAWARDKCLWGKRFWEKEGFTMRVEMSRQDKTTRGHRRRHYSASNSASPMSKLRWQYSLHSTKNSDRSPVPVRLKLSTVSQQSVQDQSMTMDKSVWCLGRLKLGMVDCLSRRKLGATDWVDDKLLAVCRPWELQNRTWPDDMKLSHVN